MKQEINEQVSAFLDDELPSRELHATLDRMLKDEKLCGVWDRYHLIGDTMRGEGVRISASGIADQVRARLELEPAIIATRAARRPHAAGISSHWLRPAAGAALAASVAALAVVALPPLTGEQQRRAPMVTSGSATPVGQRLPAQYVNSGGTRWKNLQTPEIESKLNRYLVDHSEYASSGGLGGGLPYTTFVSYDTSRP